ncbi:MAG: hypothetical protein R3327_02995, partial [Nitrosopumilaceae archaeon]|nr:hypothetical protein [Nitrosopumilaceae archaeon]
MQKCFARRFSHILTTGNAEELLTLSDQKRLLVMKALASLSKYMGCYDTWESIKKRYQLKWSNDDGLNFFNSIA